METWSAFFGLNENPFGETPDTRFFYNSDSHNAALKDLAWMITQGKGFAVLSGDVGMGKSLLCRMLLKGLQQKANTALILQPILSPTELLKAIVDDFRIGKTKSAAAKTVKAQLDLLNEFLIEEAAQGKRSILIIDDAQHLSSEALEVIRILSNLETEREKLLQIILVAQPELNEKLKLHELRQLGQRISVTTSLRPLDEANMEAYIKRRLEIAGGGSLLRFHPKAIRALYQATDGTPRLINKYCEKALALAEAQGLHLISGALIREAVLQSSGADAPSKARSFLGLFRKNEARVT